MSLRQTLTYEAGPSPKCQFCMESDSAEMLICYKCRLKWHPECVLSSDDDPHSPLWTCEKCTQVDDDNLPDRTSRSARVRRRNELRRLDEERLYLDRSEEATRQKQQFDEEYLRQKYIVLSEVSPDEEYEHEIVEEQSLTDKLDAQQLIQLLLHTMLTKLRSEPEPQADKLETIVTFALLVQNICATLESCHLEAHLRNPMLLQELVDMLLSSIKLNWAMFQQGIEDVNLMVFSDWIFNIAQAATAVSLPPMTTQLDQQNKKLKEKGRGEQIWNRAIGQR